MKERIQRLEEDGESEKVQEIHRLLDTIVVSPRLEMRLVDPHDEYFDISPITEEVQTLTMSSPTLWQWSVKALQSGEHSVFLKAVARLKMAEGEEERDIEVYQKQIAIRATATYTVGKFFSSYWEIILTAIIIPAGGWGITQYLKYRKKKKSIQKEREAKENDGYTTDSTQ